VQADPDSARAESNSPGSSPLVCSATGLSEIFSDWYLGKPPSRDIERNYWICGVARSPVGGKLGVGECRFTLQSPRTPFLDNFR
jgi:hypothetical protein